MTTTVDNPFRAKPTISEAGFRAVLEQARSPFAPLADAIYDLIVGWPQGGPEWAQAHDPSIWLAVARHEHQFGTDVNSVMFRGSTNSWTNARSVRDPSLPKGTVDAAGNERGDGWYVYLDPVRKSTYIKYRFMVDSVRDGLYRVDDPEFAYARSESILDVISIFAPSLDSNNPLRYAQAVAADAAAWATKYPITEQETLPVALTIRVSHASGPNLPKLPMIARYITVHETANTAVGANAEMHRRFVANGGGSSAVSFHYAVDDREAVEIESPAFVCWHAGDGSNGTGNRQAIAIETCVNSDGNWDQTLSNLVELVQILMTRHNIPIERVVQHNHFSGKDCPTRIRHSGIWSELKERFRGAAFMDVEHKRLLFDETGMTLQGGFLAYWRAFGGLAIFGYPLTEEFVDKESGRTMQYLERARFEHHPGAWPERFDVLLGRLGAERLDARATA